MFWRRFLGEPLRTLADFVGCWYSRRAVRSSPAFTRFACFGGASASIALARASRAARRKQNNNKLTKKRKP